MRALLVEVREHRGRRRAQPFRAAVRGYEVGRECAARLAHRAVQLQVEEAAFALVQRLDEAVDVVVTDHSGWRYLGFNVVCVAAWT